MAAVESAPAPVPLDRIVAPSLAPAAPAPAQPAVSTQSTITQQQQAAEEPAAAIKEQKEEQQDASSAGRRGLDDPACVFECNICLELASEPVVTLCGHLYCWPCLYRWMQLQSYTRQCPVCKAGVEEDTIIPIYGRGAENPAPAGDNEKAQPLPARPAGQRPAPVLLQQPSVPAPAAPAQQSRMPSIFGFQLGPGQGYVEALTPEQQHQAFLSRLLLMLGSFVIMCLLLF